MSTGQDDDMTFRQLMEAVLKAAWGTDAEMRHPRTKEEVQSKILEAHESIDNMREATGRLAKVQPARSFDEAMRQMTGG